MPIKRPKPIVNQVNDILRQRIRNRDYPPGSRLPSESNLATDLGVSRATVRTVLATLAAERLIIRKHGAGTYVNERAREVNTSLGGIMDFGHIIETCGYRPSIRSISTEKRLPTKQEISLLDITGEEQVLSLTRLFLANNRPAILSTNVLPVRLLNKEDAQYELKLLIHKFLRRYCNQEIAYAIADIRATLVFPELVGILDRELNSPLLQFMEVFFNKDNQPLACGTNYYDNQVLKLRVIQPWG